ncbi:MAG TPA: c-type cytochrome [Gammaproteobacteria bacterium]|nr:c-type cytochrome [Gammaproteobacteria bacterium]
MASTYLSPPPRNFKALDAGQVSREAFIRTVTHGKPGTAMMRFDGVLSAEDIQAVVDYVLTTFVREKGQNTRYHTPENGWEDHQRYAIAFPFALGEVSLDTPWEELTPELRRGRQLFMNSCITCHDRAAVKGEGVPWEPRAVSFPRGGYSHRQDGEGTDTTSGATPYARHDIAPQLMGLTAQERLGERLFQDNCAFCHGADGTGKNWIGSFLEPHPRDLTDPRFAAAMDREKLLQVIREGLPDTTMPAWKAVLGEDEITAVAAYVERAFFSAQ